METIDVVLTEETPVFPYDGLRKKVKGKTKIHISNLRLRGELEVFINDDDFSKIINRNMVIELPHDYSTVLFQLFTGDLAEFTISFS